MSMGTDHSGTRTVDRTAAVSETIGAVLLVSVVVVSVSLIGLFLFSQQTPTKIPNLNFMVGTNAAQTILYLYHNGGDTLNAGEFSVLVDGIPASYSVSGGGTQWSLGKNLVVPIATPPKEVMIVYNGTGMGGTGGAVLLRSGSANSVKTVNITPDESPYLDCAAVKNWDCADQIPPEIVIAQYMKNSTTKRIMFMQHGQSRGTVIGAARNHFNFTVAKPNSTIHIAAPSNPNCDAGNLYNLPEGTKVGVTFIANPDYFTVYGMAPQIWEMTAGANSRMRTTLSFTNGTKLTYTGNPICHAYISEYSDLDSTLDVTTTSPGRVTFLFVNKTRAIEGPSSTTVKLINVQPIDNGLFLVTYGANTAPIYVIGWADAIQYNGVNQTGLGF
jgi:FlaG/FlaF family flagellin (archaellin)